MRSNVERIFLNWDRPALHAAGEYLAGTYAENAVLDLSTATVILPGSRPGRRLKELLLDEAERRNALLRPPRVSTIGMLPELLYEPSAPLVEDVAARRAWSEAMQAESRSSTLDPLFPHPPEPEDLRGWDGLAAEVQHLHHEVTLGGHRFEDVARIVEDPASDIIDETDRWTALARLEAAYQLHLQRSGRADRNLERIKAARRVPSFAGDLWLVGIAEVPGIVRQLIESGDIAARILIHAPEHEADAFDDLGCVKVQNWKHRTIDIAEDQLRIVDRPAEQADAVILEIADLEDDTATDEVSIALPDASLIPFVEQRLESWGIQAHNAAGRDLPSMPTFTFLAAVTEYLTSGKRWTAFATLLRHPHLNDYLARKGVRNAIEAADRYYEKHLPATTPARFRREHATLAAAHSSVEQLVAHLAGKNRLSEWGPFILKMLEELYGERELDRSTRRDRRLIESLDIIRKGAIALSSLHESLDPGSDGATALALLLDILRNASIPDDPEHAAVELLGWLELHLDDAPVAMVLSFNEPFLPQSLVGGAFLPDKLRTHLGLIDNEARYARDAYQLTAIRASRESLSLVAGRLDTAGDPLRPSRLMLTDKGQELARRVLRFARPDEEPPRPAIPEPAPLPQESALRLPPEPTLTFTPPERLRVTQFRGLIANPYLFVVQQVMGLESVDDAQRELDGASFGSLIHCVLRDFGFSDLRGSTSEDLILHHLLELLEAEAARRYDMRSLLPAVRIQLYQLRRRLAAFAAWQAARAEAGWEIKFVEGAPVDDAEKQERTLAVSFDVDDQPITLSGRVDRIDFNQQTEEWAILDYKTGDSGDSPEKAHRKGRSDKEWIDLQLPLYRHLVTRPTIDGAAPLLQDVDPDGLGLGFVLLPRSLDDTREEMALWNADELADADDLARELVRMLRAGSVTFDAERPAKYLDSRTAALLGQRLLLAVDTDDETSND